MKEESIVALWTAGIGVAGTLLGTVLGGLITWLLTRSTNRQQRALAEQAERAQQRTTLDSLIIKMIDLSMEYPYLERKEVTVHRFFGKLAQLGKVRFCSMGGWTACSALVASSGMLVSRSWSGA